MNIDKLFDEFIRTHHSSVITISDFKIFRDKLKAEYALVPLEPTPEMMMRGVDEILILNPTNLGRQTEVKDIYKAMIKET